jgi:tol-pal system-associated acyl-CoA thioesterase
MDSSTPTPPLHLLRQRIYWEDTDAGGVVYYANYLKFCERARTEWLRGLGFQQQQMAERDGLLFVVSTANLRYAAPARLDDEIDVSVVVVDAGGASLDLRQEVRRHTAGAAGFADQPLLATLQVRVACVRADTMRPARLPVEVLRALSGGKLLEPGGAVLGASSPSSPTALT